ncbi:MAG: hypothetical protein JWO62_359 [Acidimicrobiaceae bacterium]|nr:hypothetical protein [Acidimicrobiaceae bacterium]
MSDVDDAAGVLDAADSVLGAVEGALAKLEEGRYGRCEVCGAEIDDAVLATAPVATRCADHEGADHEGADHEGAEHEGPEPQ